MNRFWGAKDAGNQRHLLAVLAARTAQASAVAAQAEVGAKAILGHIDPHGKLVSADALHTVKATAEFIHEAGGEFVLPMKENRKTLFDALDALPWDQVPVTHSVTDRGHRRITTRAIRVLPAPEDLPFPHVTQVMAHRAVRHRPTRQPGLGGGRARRGQPAPEQVSAVGLAWHAREQWAIESLHWLRDTLYQADKSQVKTPVRAENHGCSA